METTPPQTYLYFVVVFMLVAMFAMVFAIGRASVECPTPSVTQESPTAPGVASTEARRLPQPDELWEFPRSDPSPWQSPTIVYQICEVGQGWVRYIHYPPSIHTCNDTTSTMADKVESFVHYWRPVPGAPPRAPAITAIPY